MKIVKPVVKRGFGLKDKYLSPLVALFFTFISFNAAAQYDSTKTKQPVNGYGFTWKNGGFGSQLSIPRDTIKLAMADSGSISFRNGALYVWNGYKWNAPAAISAWGAISGSINSQVDLIDSLNKRVTGAFRTNDSVYLCFNGFCQFFYKDSIGGGGATDTASLSNRINLKVNIADTGTMLANYRHWLAGYLKAADIAGKVNFSDTAAMLSNYRHWLQGYLKAADIANKQNTSDTTSFDATKTDVARGIRDSLNKYKLYIRDSFALGQALAYLKNDSTLVLKDLIASGCLTFSATSDTTATISVDNDCLDNTFLKLTDTVSRVRLITVSGDSLIYYTGSTRVAVYLGAGGGGAIDTLWTERRNADYNELAKVQKIQVQTRTGTAGDSTQNMNLYSEQLNNGVYDLGSNVSITATNVANDLEGNSTLDEITSTFAGSNPVGQTITVTPGDSLWISFDARLPPSGGVTDVFYQIVNGVTFSDIVYTSYFSQINNSTPTRIKFGILIPGGCTSVFVRFFGSGSSAGVLWAGRLQTAIKHKYNYVETTSTASAPNGSSGYTYKNVLVSDDDANLYLKDIKWQPASQRYAGYTSVNDKKRIDAGGIAPVKYTSISNGEWYDGFPFSTVIKDTVYTAFSRKECHVCVGWIPLFASYDGGYTFDSVGVVAPIGNNVILTADSDTLFTSWEDAPLSNYQYFGYSSNGGRTWIKTDSIDHPTANTVAFGKLLRLPSGKRIIPYYLYGASWEIGLFESNDGLNWSLGTVIASGSNGAVELNEIWIENITPFATADADVKLVAIVRNEGVTGEHYFYRSSNGGSSWTFTGRDARFKSTDDIYGYPMEVVLYNGKLGLIAGRRINEPGVSTAYDFNVGISWANPDAVFADTSKWGLPNRIYNAEANYAVKGFSNDFGYTFTYLLNGQLNLIGYDVAPANSPLDSTKTRIFTMPVLQAEYAEYFSNTNQSISVALETKVSFTNTWFNTGGLSLGADTLITITKDGWYNLNAEACYSAGYNGSLRKVYLKVVNPGLSSANRIVSAQTNAATENLNFLKFELNTTQYLRAGEKVGLYTYTDGTGGELRNQNEYQNRAKIRIVKLEL